MAGGEVAEHKQKGKSKKKKGKRLGVRMDMTPLVDVAFLLLTFFMYTTSMSRPQTMEINLPPDQKVHVETAESNLLTIRVNDKGIIFWNIGLDAPVKIEFKDLRPFLLERGSTNPRLTVLLKIDRLGKYEMMVNLIDELNESRITRFSLAPLLDQDKALLAKVSV
jgi:biopolymer transport protein ExbD